MLGLSNNRIFTEERRIGWLDPFPCQIFTPNPIDFNWKMKDFKDNSYLN